MNPTYKYYLKKNTSTWYTVEDGAVKTTTTETDIEKGIINWREMELSWVRHERYHGMFRKQSISLQFCKEMAKVIRYVYLTQGGVMANCEFVLKVYNESTFSYSTLFTCPIDFATYNSTRDYVECTLMENGLSALVTAYEDLEYETQYQNPDYLNVTMPGIRLKTQYVYGISSYSDTVSQAQQEDVMRLIYVRQVGDFTPGVGNSPNFTSAANSHFFYASVTNVDEFIVQFSFNITYSNVGASNKLKIRLSILDLPPDDPSASFISQAIVWADASDLAGGGTRTVTATGSFTGSLVWGYYVVLKIESDKTSGSATTLSYTINNGSFSVLSNTGSGSGTTKAFRLPNLITRHLEAMTNSKYPLNTNYLWNQTLNPDNNYDATPYNLFVTSETALKGATVQSVKTKLQDLNQLLLSLFGAGIGTIDDTFRVEKLSYFYNASTVIHDFGENYTDFSHEQAGKYIINKAEVGYSDYDAIDDLNKPNEFNTKYILKFPIDRVMSSNDQTWDLLCPYPASMYYIELVRAQNLQNTKTVNNTKRDESNRNFLLYLNGSTLDKTGTVTGIDNPTYAYNVPISPKRNFLRNSGVAKAICSMLPYKLVGFQTAEQTKDVASNMGSGNIFEGTTVNLATTGESQLFYPIIIKFKAPAPVNLAQLMLTNPYGVMRVKYNGENVDGFILKASINPGKQDVFEFELLLSPNTNPAVLA